MESNVMNVKVLDIFRMNVQIIFENRKKKVYNATFSDDESNKESEYGQVSIIMAFMTLKR